MIHSASARRKSPARSRRRSLRRLAGLFLFAALLAWGCAKPPVPVVPTPPPVPVAPTPPPYAPLPPEQALERVRAMLPASQGLDSWSSLKPGLSASLAYVSAKPQENAAFLRPGYRITWSALRQTLEELIADLPALDAEPGLLARDFTWFPLRPNTLVTGYYEPYLEASLTRRPDYPYPVYGVPKDLRIADLGAFRRRWRGQKLYYRMTKRGIKPYYSREAIDFHGALAGKGAELAWVRDRVDLYFLQIQGSGRLILPDGTVRHALYADKNGRDLTMLGGTMVRGGYLPRSQASNRRIKAFIREHPDLAERLLGADLSYVFFRLSDDGPFGSMGRLLTPMSSIAVDRRVVPLGAPLAISVPLPTPRSGGPDRLAGLALAQDTGGAIVGNHVDLFCGSGDYAEYVANNMKYSGELYVLVSNSALRALGPDAAGESAEDSPLATFRR